MLTPRVHIALLRGRTYAAHHDVRDRYGPNSLMRAVLLGRDLGLSVSLLPD